MGSKRYYAHSKEDRSQEEWQPLAEHLENVAKIARAFAEEFNAGNWGYVAGLWHDIGKYSYEFQERLSAQGGVDAHIETKAGRVDHSTAGAQHAFKSLGDIGKMLAYAIAGHHAGLLDGKSNDACLHKRLQKSTIPDYSSCPEHILDLKGLNKIPLSLDVRDPKRFAFQLSFFIRMIYSCLVDADFLDTEAFMNKERSLWRKGYPSLSELKNRFDSSLDQLARDAPETMINKQRAAILNNCLDVAELPRGLFSLTVPNRRWKDAFIFCFCNETCPQIWFEKNYICHPLYEHYRTECGGFS